MSDCIHSARHEGAEARTAGHPFQSNPYPLGTQASREWSKGYNSKEYAKVVYCVDCGTRICRRATRCRSCNAKRTSARPETRLANSIRINRPDVRAKMAEARNTPESRQRQSESQRAVRLRHIHEDYRDLYMELSGKATAAERFAMIQLQMRKDGVVA